MSKRSTRRLFLQLDDLNDSKWNLELAWLTKALEPALQLCRWALPAGNGDESKTPPRSRSVSEIIASIQKSKAGIQDWSLSDVTVGLYLIFLRRASSVQVEDVKGAQISSDSIVQDLIYHTELAKGAYKESATGLAKRSMLREQNVLKFIKNSSVMRPGYYIGIDIRNKLVVFGIRGTHTVYDLITNIVSSSDREVTFEGYSTHFGTAEAARWFLDHEMGTIRKCLEKHEGFRLRLVGHSLGGATAALLAIMLRKRSQEELGFNPDIVSAVGIGTPPCVSKELAEGCYDYVSTLVLQDDIIPRLSVASLRRLRNEILQNDWMTVLEKEDWKSVVDVVANAKQVVSSVQDTARKLADYANFRNNKNLSDVSTRKESVLVTQALTPSSSAPLVKQDEDTMPEELFVPGTLYFLKRELDSKKKGRECFTLLKRHPGEHFEKIVLSSNIISDHKCDNHYFALRDVLKSLPGSDYKGIYR
ncbi:sn1-specific diacylglycerol lipase beta [Thalictrum thalictroides]|uniref:Sn1-specific diacylglycerol lipase beta n=1 Tax=Thalictrum thalictroides TaxID=46969 RepID=A0A7J6V5D1_THATH|nr:sn1-specific diacylglycerol lipase beta [Thalictrum thalictroides]